MTPKHGGPPQHLVIALAVAMEDFAEHPERWDYDPTKFPADAAWRVWSAVEPLLSVETENSRGVNP